MTTSIFVQSAGPAEGRSELARVFGAGTVQRVVPALVVPRSVLAGLKRVTGLVLHHLARALYVSPALLGASLLLRAFDGPVGLVVVGFCALVVAFFLALNVFIILSLLAWLEERRHKRGGQRWKALSPRALPAAAAVRVQGRVERIGSATQGVVLRDFWADAELAWRVTESAVFLVRPDDPRAEPAVVACTTAPDVTGRGAPSSGPSAIRAMSPEARALVPATSGPEPRGTLLTIAEGDRVEVRAASSEPLENLDRIPLPGGEVLVGENEGVPYRDQPEASPRAGLLLRDALDAPFAIRRIG